MKPGIFSERALGSLTLGYLALPVVIFFAGWLHPLYALAGIIPVLVCGWRLARLWPASPLSFSQRDMILAMGFAMAITGFVGIGGLAPQQSDWVKHNAVLFDCVELRWPVILPDGTARWPLVYYVAYYLPPALIGKIGGYQVAEAALWLWSTLGVMLVCLWFARLARFPVGLASMAFFGFGGLDVAADLLMRTAGLANVEWGSYFFPNPAWSGMWQFPGPFWSLTWAPGQALSGWLSAALLAASPKSLRWLCFCHVLLCVTLWSPLVATGFFLLGLFFIAANLRGVRPGAGVWAIPLAIPLLILAAFFEAKSAPDVAASFPKIPVTWFFQFHTAPSGLGMIIMVPLFIMAEFGLFLWFIRAAFGKGTEDRRLANASGLALLGLLPVTIGQFSDLSMRASVAPMFWVAVLTVRTIAPEGVRSAPLGNWLQVPCRRIVERLRETLNRFPRGFSPARRRWFWLVLIIASLTPAAQVFHQYSILFNRRYTNWRPRQVSAVVNMGTFPVYGAQYVGSTNAFFWRHLAGGH